MNWRRIFLHALAVVTIAGTAEGEEAGPLRSAAAPNPSTAAAQIDALLAAHWKSAKVPANAPSSDETFLRRVYLDLAGRIPTPAEAQSFLDSRRADKRAALIDELLTRESYVSHFFHFWADILRLKSYYVNTANVVPAAYAQWLKQSLRTNKPYDEFVREMLSARGPAWENGAIGYYLRDPEMPLDNMALTSRVFLGTRIECAQCHDHPFDKWKQTEFYHVAAYTFGNYSVNEALGGVRAEFRAREQAIHEDFVKEKAASSDGGKAAEQRKKERLDAMEFRPVLNIIRQGIGQLLSPVGLDRKGEAVLKLPFDFEEADGKPGDVMTPRPLFGSAPEASAGSDLADVFARWVTSPDNPRFTRVIVNRLWKKLFGVALSEPLDDLREGRAAALPELEDYLVKLMIAQRYDLRAFLSTLARTRAYQATVMREEFSADAPWHFQGPLLRRMTAEQAWDSLVALASYEPDARDLEREAREQRRIDVSRMVFDAYARFDGKRLVDLGYSVLSREKALQQRELAAREAAVEAKRRGELTRETELRREQGKLSRERSETYVREFLRPLLVNLARELSLDESSVVEDETYQMNPNPAVHAVETWRKMYVPGYGPPPKAAAQREADARAAKQRLQAQGEQLGFTGKALAEFVTYAEKAQAEWRRASELESPSPRGHFLRTMGQSDRDFVENANPNASIPQALAMMNSELFSSSGLLSPCSPLMHFVQRQRTPDDHADAAWLAILSRRPTTSERTLLRDSAAGKSGRVEDLIIALLNTKQFLFIQ